MKNLILILGLIFSGNCIFAADKSPQPSPQPLTSISVEALVYGPIYKSEGYSLLLDAEWIMIDIAGDGNEIGKMWYWNDLFDEKEELDVVNYRFYDNDEFSGFKGVLFMDERMIPVDFVIEDDTLTLIRDEGDQVFTFDSWNYED